MDMEDKHLSKVDESVIDESNDEYPTPTSKHKVYYNQKDDDHVILHIPRGDEDKKGDPRFVHIKKSTGDWKVTHSKMTDSEPVASGKGNESLRKHFNESIEEAVRWVGGKQVIVSNKSIIKKHTKMAEDNLTIATKAKAEGKMGQHHAAMSSVHDNLAMVKHMEGDKTAATDHEAASKKHEKLMKKFDESIESELTTDNHGFGSQAGTLRGDAGLSVARKVAQKLKACRLVKDKKTGQEYDPDEKFDQLLKHPDTVAIMKRLKDR